MVELHKAPVGVVQLLGRGPGRHLENAVRIAAHPLKLTEWMLATSVGEDRVVRQRVVVEVQPLDTHRADRAAGVLHLEARLDGVAAPQVDAPALLAHR